MSLWEEIKCVHFDEEEQKWLVDAWLTDGGVEEGKVIAKLDLQRNVEYLDERAKADSYAQEIIEIARFDILADRAYELYTKDWCESRGYDLTDYDLEHGFNGESFVCFDEFTNTEFRDAEYMSRLLDGNMDLWLEIVNKQRHNPLFPSNKDNFNNNKNALILKLKRGLYLAGLIIQVAGLICFHMDFHRPIAITVVSLIAITANVEEVVKSYKRKNRIAFVLGITCILSLIFCVVLFLNGGDR